MTERSLRAGWAQADLTPDQPVAVVGQFHARVSEGVRDPITATAFVLENGGPPVAFVSCDLVGVPDVFRAAVVARLTGPVTADCLVMNATHTHTGPEVRLPDPASGTTSCGNGVDLPVMPEADYIAFAADRIAAAVAEAWARRGPARVAYGLGQAVVGRNRRWVDRDGASTMYGNTNTPAFGHIEGYEDHSVNILATYDEAGALTGVVVNVPCPSQVEEHLFVLSADYWHETRCELRRRLGDKLFVLPQCSAAGDQSPHLLYERRAHERMWALAGKTQRQAIADALADTVVATLELIAPTATGEVVLEHRVERLELPFQKLTADQAAAALAQAEQSSARYEAEQAALAASPELREQPRWYVGITGAFRHAAWSRGAAERFRRQDENPTRRVDLHFVRLGDVAFATNPFEYYLDHGIAIKARSAAAQTFLVQLAGGGTYVPSLRSTLGGGYGSIPASNPLGPEAGRAVAERTIETIDSLFQPDFGHA